MKKSKSAISLGTLQENAESSSKELRAAQANFQRAVDRLTAAQEANTQAIIGLNQGLSSIKAACYVPNLMAK
jgi:hypothetical protein